MGTNLFDQRGGFLEFLTSGKFSDCVLFHAESGKTYKVHQMILAHHSEFFRGLLAADCRETNTARIELGYPDPCDLFQHVLRFLYGGEIYLVPRNIMSYLALADHYLIEELRDLCTPFMTSSISTENVIEVLKQAVGLHKADQIIDTYVFPQKGSFFFISPPPFLFIDSSHFIL